MLFTRLLPQVPSQCAVCHGWGKRAVCEACLARYVAPVPRCQRCALQVPAGVTRCGACLVDPPPYDAALAGVHYAHPWSMLITRFKFHEALDLTQVLADLLVTAQRGGSTSSPDVLLPVPLSDQRLQDRGYNQSWELTRHIGQALNIPVDARLLLRIRHSSHQLSLPPEERAANVRGAFAVEPLRRDELQGRHVAVIDDVMTTGATFAEIARVLKQAGAARVEAWALARTPRPGD